jgi:hypothetical protein
MNINLTRGSMTCAVLLATAGAAALFGLGPLDPPNGPITSTYKTLTEVEPRIAIQSLPGDASSVRVISAPGSYYLAADLVVPNGKRGIRVAAGVSATIDLNGFTIREQAQSSLEGILVDGAASGITIRNGRIRGGTTGIAAASAVDCTVERITVDSVAAEGIRVGVGGLVTDCTARACGAAGINTGIAGMVVRCNVRDNGGVGIDVDDSSIVRDCIVTSNTSHGISANDGCSIAGCTVFDNTGTGILAEDACIVSDSIGRQNNTGLRVGTGSGVSSCTAYANSANGIEFGSYCAIRSNHATSHPVGSGLHTGGVESRVDENHSVNNDIGIRLDGEDCTVIRNSMLHTATTGIWGGQDDYNDTELDGFNPWSNLW